MSTLKKKQHLRDIHSGSDNLIIFRNGNVIPIFAICSIVEMMYPEQDGDMLYTHSVYLFDGTTIKVTRDRFYEIIEKIKKQ